MVVAVSLEAFKDVEDLLEAGIQEKVAGIDGTVSRTANEQNGLVFSGHLGHLFEEIWIKLKIWGILPGNVDHSWRIANKKMFNFGANVNEDTPLLLSYAVCLLGRVLTEFWVDWTVGC